MCGISAEFKIPHKKFRNNYTQSYIFAVSKTNQHNAIMKIFVSCLLIAFSSLISEVKAVDLDEISITLTEDDKDGEYVDSPDKGHRSMPLSIICVINFCDKTINVTTIQDILTYEVLNSDGEYVVFSSADDGDAVEFLSGVTGTYQLRILSSTCSYVGCLNL